MKSNERNTLYVDPTMLPSDYEYTRNSFHPPPESTIGMSHKMPAGSAHMKRPDWPMNTDHNLSEFARTETLPYSLKSQPHNYLATDYILQGSDRKAMKVSPNGEVQKNFTKQSKAISSEIDPYCVPDGHNKKKISSQYEISKPSQLKKKRTMQSLLAENSALFEVKPNALLINSSKPCLSPKANKNCRPEKITSFQQELQPCEKSSYSQRSEKVPSEYSSAQFSSKKSVNSDKYQCIAPPLDSKQLLSQLQYDSHASSKESVKSHRDIPSQLVTVMTELESRTKSRFKSTARTAEEIISYERERALEHDGIDNSPHLHSQMSMRFKNFERAGDDMKKMLSKSTLSDVSSSCGTYNQSSLGNQSHSKHTSRSKCSSGVKSSLTDGNYSRLAASNTNSNTATDKSPCNFSSRIEHSESSNKSLGSVAIFSDYDRRSYNALSSIHRSVSPVGAAGGNTIERTLSTFRTEEPSNLSTGNNTLKTGLSDSSHTQASTGCYSTAQTSTTSSSGSGNLGTGSSGAKSKMSGKTAKSKASNKSSNHFLKLTDSELKIPSETNSTLFTTDVKTSQSSSSRSSSSSDSSSGSSSSSSSSSTDVKSVSTKKSKQSIKSKAKSTKSCSTGYSDTKTSKSQSSSFKADHLSRKSDQFSSKSGHTSKSQLTGGISKHSSAMPDVLKSSPNSQHLYSKFDIHDSSSDSEKESSYADKLKSVFNHSTDVSEKSKKLSSISSHGTKASQKSAKTNSVSSKKTKYSKKSSKLSSLSSRDTETSIKSCETKSYTETPLETSSKEDDLSNRSKSYRNLKHYSHPTEYSVKSVHSISKNVGEKLESIKEEVASELHKSSSSKKSKKLKSKRSSKKSNTQSTSSVIKAPVDINTEGLKGLNQYLCELPTGLITSKYSNNSKFQSVQLADNVCSPLQLQQDVYCRGSNMSKTSYSGSVQSYQPNPPIYQCESLKEDLQNEYMLSTVDISTLYDRYINAYEDDLKKSKLPAISEKVSNKSTKPKEKSIKYSSATKNNDLNTQTSSITCKPHSEASDSKFATANCNEAFSSNNDTKACLSTSKTNRTSYTTQQIASKEKLISAYSCLPSSTDCYNQICSKMPSELLNPSETQVINQPKTIEELIHSEVILQLKALFNNLTLPDEITYNIEKAIKDEIKSQSNYLVQSNLLYKIIEIATGIAQVQTTEIMNSVPASHLMITSGKSGFTHNLNNGKDSFSIHKAMPTSNSNAFTTNEIDNKHLLQNNKFHEKEVCETINTKLIKSKKPQLLVNHMGLDKLHCSDLNKMNTPELNSILQTKNGIHSSISIDTNGFIDLVIKSKRGLDLAQNLTTILNSQATGFSSHLVTPIKKNRRRPSSVGCMVKNIDLITTEKRKSCNKKNKSIIPIKKRSHSDTHKKKKKELDQKVSSFIKQQRATNINKSNTKEYNSKVSNQSISKDNSDLPSSKLAAKSTSKANDVDIESALKACSSTSLSIKSNKKHCDSGKSAKLQNFKRNSLKGRLSRKSITLDIRALSRIQGYLDDSLGSKTKSTNTICKKKDKKLSSNNPNTTRLSKRPSVMISNIGSNESLTKNLLSLLCGADARTMLDNDFEYKKWKNSAALAQI